MTSKEYYDLLVKTSAAGGFPAGVDGICRYRLPNNKRCAVGIIMPDNIYTVAFEGKNIDCLQQGYIYDWSWIPKGITVDDLTYIQNIHDSIAGNIYELKCDWPHSDFVAKLNQLRCFQVEDVVR